MTDNTSANTINDLLRSLSTWLLDRPAFLVLGLIYEIFFNVATAEILTNATVKNFYSRVQLIIGVFMVFKLAVTILQGIVNPDKMTDKNAGLSSVITRIIFSLVMLTLLVPINIPNAKNEYEIELNNNGLLFGTLYSLQNRMLTNNTLGRLILGTTDGQTASSSSSSDNTMSGADKQAAKLKKSANIFTSTILKGFLRINLVPDESREKHEEGKSDEVFNENRMCKDIGDETIEIYKKLDVDPQSLLSLINASCSTAKDSSWFGEAILNKALSIYKRISGTDRYVFAYIPILPAIVAFIFAFILLGFTVDIAVRAVKLAVLRLIAPIPIISYIQPESAKKGAFASWVKTLTSTYLDLFIRLSVVYFVIFLIQDMIVNGIVINNGTGMIGILSSIMIWIGLFFFAKQAPKFIKDVLGLQGLTQNIGLSAMMAGTAALTSGGGLKGAASASIGAAESQVAQYNTGKRAPIGAWQQGKDLAAQITTGDSKAKGGFLNNMNSRLMRDAQINAAEREYGVTAQGLEISNTNQKNAASAAAEAQDLYQRFSKGNQNQKSVSDEEFSRLSQKYGTDNYDAIREKLYADSAAKAEYAQKAKKDYDETKKFADQHHISPSYAEKHKRSFKERFRTSGNADEANGRYASRLNNDLRYTPSGRRTQHQTLRDRYEGAPEDWRVGANDPKSARRDNRWDPNKFNNIPGDGQAGAADTQTNSVYQDGNMATSVPGEGGIPGLGASDGPGHGGGPGGPFGGPPAGPPPGGF